MRPRVAHAPPRIGLVLGAGGVPGLAFHIGALSVLEHDLGWDARDAAVIVGTSAGAVVAGFLRGGVSPCDLAAAVTGTPAAATHAAVRSGEIASEPSPPWSLRALVGPPRWPPPAPWVTQPWRVRPRHVAAGLVRDGRLDPRSSLHALARVLPRWPDHPLRVCTVRHRTLERTVFASDAPGRGDPVDAIAASCAVPGVFAPVRVGDERFVDGGVHSPTNADVIRPADALDAVVVVSPLTGAGDFPGIRWAVRRAAQRHLVRELAGLSVPVIVLEPPRRVSAHLPLSPLDDRTIGAVIRESFLSAPEWLHDHSAAEALRIVRAAGRRSRAPATTPGVNSTT